MLRPRAYFWPIIEVLKSLARHFPEFGEKLQTTKMPIVLQHRCRWAPFGRRCRSISPARTALRSKPAAAAVEWWDRQTNTQTDGRTLDRFIDPAAMRAVSLTHSRRWAGPARCARRSRWTRWRRRSGTARRRASCWRPGCAGRWRPGSGG